MMLHIFICEDNSKYRERVEKVIKDYIAVKDYDIDLALSTGSPTDILDYLKKHPTKKGLFFLDVNLYHEINGINLAIKIKEINSSAKIVFITIHAELSFLIFMHKIEALDYIIKDMPVDIEPRVMECISTAYKRYLDDKVPKYEHDYFKVRSGSQTWNIHIDEILFFETHLSMKHKVVLHMVNSQIEYRAPISEIADSNPNFYRCHKSFVINIKHIKLIDKAKNYLEMSNGEIVPITVRKISELLKLMG